VLLASRKRLEAASTSRPRHDDAVHSEPITSPKNPLVRRLQRAADGDERDLMLAEGVRLVEEALAAELQVEVSLASPRLLHNDRGRELAARLVAASADHRECSDEVLERASQVATHQGVLALLRRPQWDDAAFFRGEAPFLAVAAGVRDPGNVGALVRTAEAAGASGLLVLSGSADPFRDKALRGSAGSVFRLPCRKMSVGGIRDLAAEHGATLIATEAEDGEDLFAADFGKAPQIFVLGGEAEGIPDDLRQACTRRVRIPITPPVESLNVAVAAGIVLFEHRRRLRHEP
jgi:TrmH family RNA methyltransferase